MYRIGLILLLGLTTLPAAWAQDRAIDLDALQCTGTEPFWSLRLGHDRMVYDDIDGNEIAFASPAAETTMNRTDRWIRTGISPGGALATAVLLRAEGGCSDMMSDKLYPVEVILLGVGSRAVAGCCGPAR